eukprot:TRINITY_DN12138_c0_g3_i1.p1 TRINITY_DN12138_c0_g3~~TRINITY_DN12138_c0_g3_i1.p1  ORF type:complete len:618 (+),score=96.54 TRINITY_DN12138_c0_g3_i1:18-1871(+)
MSFFDAYDEQDLTDATFSVGPISKLCYDKLLVAVYLPPWFKKANKYLTLSWENETAFFHWHPMPEQHKALRDDFEKEVRAYKQQKRRIKANITRVELEEACQEIVLVPLEAALTQRRVCLRFRDTGCICIIGLLKSDLENGVVLLERLLKHIDTMAVDRTSLTLWKADAQGSPMRGGFNYQVPPPCHFCNLSIFNEFVTAAYQHGLQLDVQQDRIVLRNVDGGDVCPVRTMTLVKDWIKDEVVIAVVGSDDTADLTELNTPDDSVFLHLGQTLKNTTLQEFVERTLRHRGPTVSDWQPVLMQAGTLSLDWTIGPTTHVAAFVCTRQALQAYLHNRPQHQRDSHHDFYCYVESELQPTIQLWTEAHDIEVLDDSSDLLHIRIQSDASHAQDMYEQLLQQVEEARANLPTRRATDTAITIDSIPERAPDRRVTSAPPAPALPGVTIAEAPCDVWHLRPSSADPAEQYHYGQARMQFHAMFGNTRAIRRASLLRNDMLRRRYMCKKQEFGDHPNEIWTFHGAPLHVHDSILMRGMLIGDKDIPDVNAVCEGHGVYSATSPSTPLGYSGNGTVFLLRGLQGRIGAQEQSDCWHPYRQGHPNHDWRIFATKAQVLPTYLIEC